jgi:hypothetical protein
MQSKPVATGRVGFRKILEPDRCRLSSRKKKRKTPNPSSTATCEENIKFVDFIFYLFIDIEAEALRENTCRRLATILPAEISREASKVKLRFLRAFSPSSRESPQRLGIQFFLLGVCRNGMVNRTQIPVALFAHDTRYFHKDDTRKSLSTLRIRIVNRIKSEEERLKPGVTVD